MQQIIHPWPAFYTPTSKILILGTIPSPKSREFGFFYSHPQNRFWKILLLLMGEETKQVTLEARQQFLVDHDIALWDVLHSCRIKGAGDSSIREPAANDFTEVLQNAPIRAIFTTGRKATQLYEKLVYPQTRRASIYLPSTSPANKCFFPDEVLLESWQIIKSYLL